MNKVTDWLQTFKKMGPIGQSVKTVAVLSGKGGVGKTSCALRLAHDISLTGKKVLLIDCDYNLSNTLLKLNIPMRSRFVSYLKKEENLTDCIVKVNKLHLLPTCNGNIEIFDQKYKMQTEIIKIIEECEKNYDFIILDCPAGIGKEVMNLAAYCDLRLVLLTADKSSMTDAYSLTKILIQRYGTEKNYYLLNKAPNSKTYGNIKKTFERTTRNFLDKEARFLGTIPYCDFELQNFDKEFIFGENTSLQESSTHIISQLYELAFGGVGVSGSNIPSELQADAPKPINQPEGAV